MPAVVEALGAGLLHLLFLYSAIAAALAAAAAGWVSAQAPAHVLLEGYKLVEVASVADAMEQLYAQRAHMSHDMRPVFKTKFAGRAVTVLLKKEEHKDGAKTSQGMLDAIDQAGPGSVYVMVLEDGLDVAGIGGLMATAMKFRGLAGAVVDASVRDLPQIQRIQFPVFSRGVAPSTSINHFRFAGMNVPVVCAGVNVSPGDIVAADEDGVAVAPADKAAAVLKKAQENDDTEHKNVPLHREVPFHPGGGREVRAHLTERRSRTRLPKSS